MADLCRVTWQRTSVCLFQSVVFCEWPLFSGRTLGREPVRDFDRAAWEREPVLPTPRAWAVPLPHLLNCWVCPLQLCPKAEGNCPGLEICTSSAGLMVQGDVKESRGWVEGDRGKWRTSVTVSRIFLKGKIVTLQ